VPVKTPEQQGILCVHRLREGFKEERTACINRIRGLLAEFGIVLPQSPRVLHTYLHDILEDTSNDIANAARIALQRALMHWQELDEHLHGCEQRFAAHCKEDEQVQRAAAIKGLGLFTASAMVATVGDFKQFKNGAQFAAWLGLTPRQTSSEGKSNLGAITKRGDRYLLTLLVQGARAAVLTSKHNLDPICQWMMALRQRSGWQKAVVALANKNARILWALMTHERTYDAGHASERPRPPVSAVA
ncbi:IS110 family transposase, partial [Comamonas testosteroni]|uniref:IS110 family transposase n=1 Tax=Comamonas testosteroni TaxID=285 RepID=UPI00391C50B4